MLPIRIARPRVKLTRRRRTPHRSQSQSRVMIRARQSNARFPIAHRSGNTPTAVSAAPCVMRRSRASKGFAVMRSIVPETPRRSVTVVVSAKGRCRLARRRPCPAPTRHVAARSRPCSKMAVANVASRSRVPRVKLRATRSCVEMRKCCTTETAVAVARWRKGAETDRPPATRSTVLRPKKSVGVAACARPRRPAIHRLLRVTACRVPAGWSTTAMVVASAQPIAIPRGVKALVH
jgi:hypothetical protein